MARRKLQGKAKQQVDAAMRRRHNEPALAAKHLRELFGYMPPEVVWDEIRRINPQAVDELQAALRTHHVGQAA